MVKITRKYFNILSRKYKYTIRTTILLQNTKHVNSHSSGSFSPYVIFFLKNTHTHTPQHQRLKSTLTVSYVVN